MTSSGGEFGWEVEDRTVTTTLDARAQELIEALSLSPHPEGGHYKELHRSALTVTAGGSPRSAITCIYFLLARGEVSRWHRLHAGDELWHHLEGDPLELLIADAELSTVRRSTLGRLSGEVKPQEIVPAGCWQAARPLGAYALLGCSVGPGFEFSDFQMLSALPAAEAKLAAHSPDVRALL